MCAAPASSGSNFPSTQWSAVVRIANPDPEVRNRALETLLRTYWNPLLTHLVRGRRIDPHQAEDLLQNFVVDKLVAQGLFEGACRGRGRLRTLLVTALDHYRIDRHRYDNAQKRAPAKNAKHVPLDPAAPLVAPDGGGVDSFDVAWARETLDHAIEAMRRECRQEDRRVVWEVFEARLLGPLLRGTEPVPHDQLAQGLGLKSPVQTSEALVSAKRIFLRCLREVVGQYVVTPEEIDEEINELKRILAGSFP